jgi:hypothetical protein
VAESAQNHALGEILFLFGHILAKDFSGTIIAHFVGKAKWGHGGNMAQKTTSITTVCVK